MTGKRECPSCAAMVPVDSTVCFVCGYEFAGRHGKLSWRTLVALVLLAVFLIPLIRFVSSLLK
ncbi:MAG TPA: zinc ribbon domain-containing protein [candidate division Zixibacteria bacterium]|jgi:RNA polymerase subunit RPABC4/transcription elongation factor Spt4